jgi:hypothetical protein
MLRGEFCRLLRQAVITLGVAGLDDPSTARAPPATAKPTPTAATAHSGVQLRAFT